MTKKSKEMIAIGCLSALTIGLSIGFVSKQPSFDNGLIRAQADQYAVNFNTETITRRIWIVNENNWADWNKQFFIHAWNPTDNTKNFDSLMATEAYGTYYQGLYFADVTFQGAGASINLIVRGGDGSGNVKVWGDYNQTETLTLPALNSSSGDVIWLDYADNKNNETDHRWDRGIGPSSIKTASLGSAELAAILEQFQSCSSSYALGYNAYPQLKKDILDVSTVDENTPVQHQTYNDSPFETTIKTKIAELKKQYDAKGWYVA